MMINMKKLKPLVVSILLINPITSFAHAHLHSAEPAQNSVITKPAEKVVLHFTEALEVPLCKITVVNASSNEMVSAKDVAVIETDTKSIMIKLNTLPVKKDDYKVTWKVVSTDGHKMQGEYRFTYAPTLKSK